MNSFMKCMMLGVVLFTGVNAFYTAEGSSGIEDIIMQYSAASIESKQEIIRELELKKEELLKEYENTNKQINSWRHAFDVGKVQTKVEKDFVRKELEEALPEFKDLEIAEELLDGICSEVLQGEMDLNEYKRSCIIIQKIKTVIANEKILKKINDLINYYLEYKTKIDTLLIEIDKKNVGVEDSVIDR